MCYLIMKFTRNVGLMQTYTVICYPSDYNVLFAIVRPSTQYTAKVNWIHYRYYIHVITVIKTYKGNATKVTH